MTAAELYAAYQSGYHGVVPFESMSPTEQSKWQAVADYIKNKSKQPKTHE